jgi:hypothetical protein
MALPLGSASAIDRLTQTIAAVCPIVGVAILDTKSPPDVRIDYAPAATAQQQAAAQQALSAFDWSAAGQATWANTQAVAAAQASLADTVSSQGKALQAIMKAANLTPAQVQALVQ